MLLALKPNPAGQSKRFDNPALTIQFITYDHPPYDYPANP
jgi:hypothetical protein